MRKYFGLILILFFVSCSEKESFIYYSYNNITVTRVDKGNVIRFYYGKFDNTLSLPDSYIKSTYSGFDGLMSCYMIFQEDKKVEFVITEGSFEEINTDDNLKIIEFNSNTDFRKWTEKMEGKYKNVMELSDVWRSEIERNKKNNSEVVSIYPEN